MESMRDTRRIMEKEIKKGSTPLRFEKISIDETCYQEIISREKFLEVLRYLHRVGEYKTYANKMVINNVYLRIYKGRYILSDTSKSNRTLSFSIATTLLAIFNK